MFPQSRISDHKLSGQNPASLYKNILLYPGTNDEYEVGDLSGKYGSFQNLAVFTKKVVDYNLPMFGRNSIQGRSILIHRKEKNARWVCSNLKPVFDVGTTFVMRATANFTGPDVKGMIVMVSYILTLKNQLGFNYIT